MDDKKVVILKVAGPDGERDYISVLDYLKLKAELENEKEKNAQLKIRLQERRGLVSAKDKEIEELHGLNDKVIKERNIAKGEIEGLQPYIQHHDHCNVGIWGSVHSKCKCGLQEILNIN